MKKIKNIVFLDCSIASYNKGTDIIMQSTVKGMRPVTKGHQVTHFPTHTPSIPLYQRIGANNRYKNLRDADYKFLCGENVITTSLLCLKPFFNTNIFNCKPLENTVTLGVGLWKNGRYDAYTKHMWRKILSHDYYHSVRDDATKKMLEDLGLKAINTGCCTFWGLTDEHCAQIHTQKGHSVITSFSDRITGHEQELMDMLLNEYDKVYCWVQKAENLENISRLKNADRMEIIPPNIDEYAEVLDREQGDIDYVGQRLHGGIFAMQHKARTIILGVDNRVRDMSATFNINGIPANEIDEIRRKIKTEFETKVNIDSDKINEFLSQFM